MIIDAKSAVPIFRQIAVQVRQRIASRIYRPGESLPSLRSLAIEIKVNVNTIQKAYDELAREGLIESRRGAGLFVVEPTAGIKSNSHEEICKERLQRVISAAFKKRVSPERVRTLFREALEIEVAAISSRQT